MNGPQTVSQEVDKVKRVKAHKLVSDASKSPLERYQNVVVGSQSLGFTIKYELVTSLFANAPGAIGLWLRQKFYRTLFKHMGRGVVIGAGSAFHYPQQISLGRAVAFSYGCLLDARGGDETEISIDDDVIVGRNTSIVCKEGQVRIGKKVGIGAQTTISAVSGNQVEIGDNVIIAPYAYIGGVSYNYERLDVPIAEQGTAPQGGIRIEANCWLGASVTVLDGVTVGHDSIVAAGAVVTRDLPPFAIALGVPAKIARMRDEQN